MAPGSPPDDPVRGLGPSSTPPRMLQSGASFWRILSVASDDLVRGTGFTPGRSSPGASAVLHSAPVAPIRGVIFSYSLRCLGCSSPWHLVHPRTIETGGLCRASFRPGCSILGCLFIIFSPLPWMLQSVAPGSPPDDPVRRLPPCSTPPRMLQSGASFFLLSLLSLLVFAGVVLWCFFLFLRAPFVVAPLPLPPAPLSLAPCPVPRFVVCCARFPGSRHLVAVVAWHLSSCRGCGRRLASLACLVALLWCAAPCLVRSLSVLQSAFPSPWCLPPPRGLSPPVLLGRCAGHVEAGREPGSCACRWPLPRQGRWARSASYPFGAP